MNNDAKNANNEAVLAATRKKLIDIANEDFDHAHKLRPDDVTGVEIVVSATRGVLQVMRSTTLVWDKAKIAKVVDEQIAAIKSLQTSFPTGSVRIDVNVHPISAEESFMKPRGKKAAEA